MNWTPYLIVWICLGVATLGLALYRKFLTMKEDDYIHVEGWKAAEVAKQEAAAHKFHAIDRWGEALTILTTVAGLVLAVGYVYASFLRG
jgi:hypothetical protein